MKVIKFLMLAFRDMYKGMIEKELKRISKEQARIDKDRYNLESEYEEYFSNYV